MGSEMIIAFLGQFAPSLTQKTVVVLDNALIHCSDAFTEKSFNGYTP